VQEFGEVVNQSPLNFVQRFIFRFGEQFQIAQGIRGGAG